MACYENGMLNQTPWNTLAHHDHLSNFVVNRIPNVSGPISICARDIWEIMRASMRTILTTTPLIKNLGRESHARQKTLEEDACSNRFCSSPLPFERQRCSKLLWQRCGQQKYWLEGRCQGRQGSLHTSTSRKKFFSRAPRPRRLLDTRLSQRKE